VREEGRRERGKAGGREGRREGGSEHRVRWERVKAIFEEEEEVAGEEWEQSWRTGEREHGLVGIIARNLEYLPAAARERKGGDTVALTRVKVKGFDDWHRKRRIEAVDGLASLQAHLFEPSR
jgi:hypothetical protein